MKKINNEIIKKETFELGLPKAKWSLLDEKTPDKFIKKRKGRGGRVFDYVETGYVVRKLNEVFNGMWDFEILDQQVGKEHIWVKGKLTVKFMDRNGNIQTITKTQFGGSEVKRTKEGEIIDIGDDLKAAGSDALKKCASLLGIASDVYFQEKINNEEEEEEKLQKIDEVKCEVCGAPATKKSGVSQSGKEWNAIFCSVDKSHVKWL